MIAPSGFSYCTEKLVLQWFDVILGSLVDQEGCVGQLRPLHRVASEGGIRAGQVGSGLHGAAFPAY